MKNLAIKKELESTPLTKTEFVKKIKRYWKREIP